MGDARRTTAGTSYLVAKQAAYEPAIFDRFMFAYIPGLDTSATPPATEDLPIVGHRKGTFPVTRAGYINPDQVVYSVLLDTSVGDWLYNWIGLLADDDTLVGVVYVPETLKQKYDVLLGNRGNNLTRNFLMKYDDLLGITEITVEAETWQIDFMQRLNASDDLQESLARALLGNGAVFLGDGLKIENDTGFKMRAGRSVVHGMVIEEVDDIDASALGAAASKDIWLDVWRSGDLNGVGVHVTLIADAPAAVHGNYTDGANNAHKVLKIASISAGGVVTDLRGDGDNLLLPTDDALSSLFAHAGRTDNPHGVTKAQVGLDQLPNAKGDVAANDSNTLATLKAVWNAFNDAMDAASTVWDSLVAHIANTSNPHGTTKAQVGLGALPNAKSDLLTVNDSNVLATSKAVFALKAICDAMPFSKFQQCPPQVYKGKSVGGTYVEVKSYTFGHTLGVVPKMVLMTLECIVGEGNYNVGDFLPISNSGPYSSTTAAFGHGMKKTAANIQISVDNNHGMMIHGWGLDDNFEISNDCWKIHIMVCA